MSEIIKLRTSSGETVTEKHNAQVAYEVASESIVLLENDGTLPLEKGHVALFGAGVAKNFKGGTGSGEVNERHTIGIKEGLDMAGLTSSCEAWSEAYVKEMTEAKSEYNKTHQMKTNPIKLNAADMINIMSDPFEYPYGRILTKSDLENSKSDTCIYVVSRQAGECYDKRIERGDMNLSPIEIENLKIARGYYDKLILVINIGGIIDLSAIDEIGINAIVYLGQQGQATGCALADVLLGKVNPSGHLTDTWIKSYDQIPYGDKFSYLDGDVLHAEYKEDIYVGYRYYDSFGVEPRYPFGYGLSYTNFDISDCKVAVNRNIIDVIATIRNIGNIYAGKETAQIYVSCPSNKIEREAQSLVAYAKTSMLEPFGVEKVKISFDIRDLAAYDQDSASYILEKGLYIIRVGIDSRNTICAGVVEINEDVVVSKCTNVAPNPRQDDMEILHREGDQLLREYPQDMEIIVMDAKAIPCTKYNYDKPKRKQSDRIDKLLSSMSLEEKVSLVAGTGIMDMMGGSKYIDVPGAAAFTTSKLVKKGLVNVALADGPAGLRLTRVCGMNKKGKIKQAESMMEIMENQGGLLMKLMYADLSKDTPLYQYATAFPVGTAVAQTWNQELIEKMGDAVGTEMEEYGVTFWLAPGMNIHRNPLCGRNYEYYSEDPVISGRTAAAIARGVQKHEGCYVTIKHYCCNNQEFERCNMSAYVNERALREIYLRGFEIAVREGDAKAVMTSYNMTNEQYSAASDDFCMKLMRNEWGFDGVIMTDWFASWDGLADPVEGLKGGNDLHMPGGKQSTKPILRAIKEGKLTEADLDWCCANIINAILNSKIQKEFDAAR
ncbi:MAG: glycoside hydrolase family 3 C-terminal domain-containing protein [Lachnospiraceae bacterium]|nr:glycoside hydrolase family 3 C-terminal domain-containing protein [Lachnospiraceae bacterium]